MCSDVKRLPCGSINIATDSKHSRPPQMMEVKKDVLKPCDLKFRNNFLFSCYRISERDPLSNLNKQVFLYIDS